MMNSRWFTLGSTIAVASLLAGCGGSAGSLAPSIANPSSALSQNRSARTIESAQAATYKSLYSFAGPDADGADPTSSLINYNGVLYGTTAGGGPTGDGTIFKVTTSGAESVAYSFANGNDGSQPLAGVIPVRGKFYGTTLAGGSTGGGTVFSFNPSTSAETVLYTFGTNSAADGTAPTAGLTSVQTTLYGTTSAGGANTEGAVFAINTATGAESILYSFGATASDGQVPFAGLVSSGGYLYGVTLAGGANSAGTVFKINIGTGAETVLHNFGSSATDGSAPSSTLVFDNGLLYGTTTAGGANGLGTIFSVNPYSGAETVLHSFAGAPADGNEGCLTGSGVKGRSHRGCRHSFWDNNGTLYGTTCLGGANNNGTIFSYKISGKVESVLYSFGVSPDGANPEADVTQIGNTLYGTASSGGASNNGTVFSLKL